MALSDSIKKFDDFSREFVKLARHFELRGRGQIAAGHDRSGAADLFAAAIAYGAAQWPIYSTFELNEVLEQKKTDCYRAYAQRADHPVTAVEVPYQDRSVPGYLHLPPGSTVGDRKSHLPLVVMALLLRRGARREDPVRRRTRHRPSLGRPQPDTVPLPARRPSQPERATGAAHE